ncbi:PD-(D/E)XK motif protein [Bacillus benzoevorans]|uniref:PD-(D/E)XK motif protein n=1 Tax=Bacillus benzoevorans TaxID=1456 RepID=A0A7X0LYR3_9BACI|nr:PD-(D/E)XK motif protein [Bacillus benzoevorans]MBB6447792.1 hypothetical protein [Bacillus benzoevorans]
MELSEQIRVKFAALSDGNASLLDGFSPDCASWVIKLNNTCAVGIEVEPQIKVNESFANVYFYTDHFKIRSKSKYLLVLASSDIKLRNEFAGICAIFLETGADGAKRKSLLENPIAWWINWKELIGNKSVEKTVHGVLGELIVLYYLKQYLIKDIKADNWTGPAGKSIDICTNQKNYEVKTTVIKYNNIVTISGQYQLHPANEMSLMLVKLEDIGVDASGADIVSIDILINKLAKSGLDIGELSSNVSKLGFKENSLYRKRKFRFLNLTEYPINEDFPFIDLEKLDNINNKERILQITYKIDLTGLESYEIDFKID